MEELPFHPYPPRPLTRPLPSPSYRKIPSRTPLPTRPTFAEIPYEVRQAYFYNQPPVYRKLSGLSTTTREFAQSENTLKKICAAPVSREEIIGLIQRKINAGITGILLILYPELPTELTSGTFTHYIIIRIDDGILRVNHSSYTIQGTQLTVGEVESHPIINLDQEIGDLYLAYPYIDPASMYWITLRRYPCSTKILGYALGSSINTFTRYINEYINLTVTIGGNLLLIRFLYITSFILGQQNTIRPLIDNLWAQVEQVNVTGVGRFISYFLQFLPMWILSRVVVY